MIGASSVYLINAVWSVAVLRAASRGRIAWRDALLCAATWPVFGAFVAWRLWTGR